MSNFPCTAASLCMCAVADTQASWWESQTLWRQYRACLLPPSLVSLRRTSAFHLLIAYNLKYNIQHDNIDDKSLLAPIPNASSVSSEILSLCKSVILRGLRTYVLTYSLTYLLTYSYLYITGPPHTFCNNPTYKLQVTITTYVAGRRYRKSEIVITIWGCFLSLD